MGNITIVLTEKQVERLEDMCNGAILQYTEDGYERLLPEAIEVRDKIISYVNDYYSKKEGL